MTYRSNKYVLDALEPPPMCRGGWKKGTRRYVVRRRQLTHKCVHVTLFLQLIQCSVFPILIMVAVAKVQPPYSKWIHFDFVLDVF